MLELKEIIRYCLSLVIMVLKREQSGKQSARYAELYMAHFLVKEYLTLD
jgi:hypothetical protein